MKGDKAVTFKPSLKAESERMYTAEPKENNVPKKPTDALLDEDDDNYEFEENESLRKEIKKLLDSLDRNDFLQGNNNPNPGLQRQISNHMEQQNRKLEQENTKNEIRRAEIAALQHELHEKEKKNEDLERDYQIRMQKERERNENLKNDEIDAKRKFEELYKQKVAKILNEFDKAEKVDLCFLVDCTKSMKDYIHETKSLINRLINRLDSKYKSIEFRCAFIGYRDHDYAERIVKFSFSKDISAFTSFVNNIKIPGGEDKCEDVFGGLEEITKLEWESMTRIIFHIGDSPCHGRRFYDEGDRTITDKYRNGDPRGLDINNLLKKVVELNISYYFGEVDTNTRKMIDEFNKVIYAYGGNQIKTFKIDSFNQLLDTVTKVISTEISRTQTLTLNLSHGKERKMEKLTGLNWNLENFQRHRADVISASYTGDLKSIKSQKIAFKEENYEIFLSERPFTKGQTRYAYAVILGGSKKYVAKASVFNDAEKNTYEYHKNLIETQVIASYLAKMFSKELPNEKEISFISVYLLIVGRRYFIIEEFLDGKFEKWTSNSGIINSESYASTLDAFSHWTYDATDEYLVVTDLQGFKTDHQYFLTDPAISSLDYERFSYKNLGKQGIKRYFESHQCNHICKSLRLKKNKYQNLPDRRTDK